MVMKSHPNFVMAIKHLTEYYDMKLATFGVDTDGNMIVAFPVFVQDHNSQPQTLYEIETVKVPIPDLNVDDNSYSEVRYSKPYIAISKDYYIQLRIQELRMCKQIRHTYYCEELFLSSINLSTVVKVQSFTNCLKMLSILCVLLITIIIPL